MGKDTDAGCIMRVLCSDIGKRIQSRTETRLISRERERKGGLSDRQLYSRVVKEKIGRPRGNIEGLKKSSRLGLWMHLFTRETLGSLLPGAKVRQTGSWTDFMGPRYHF